MSEPDAILPTAEKDWDALIDQGFGPLERVVDLLPWRIVTGMNVKLWNVLQSLPAGPTALAVFADTVDLSNAPAGGGDCRNLIQTLVFARTIVSNGAVKFHRTLGDTKDWMCFGVYAAEASPLQCTLEVSTRVSTLGENPKSRTLTPNSNCNGYKASMHYAARGGYALAVDGNYTDPAGIPLEPLRALLRRELAAAAWFAAQGDRETAQALLSRATGFASWLSFAGGMEEVFTEATAIKELMQPLSQPPDNVPYLSPQVYAEVATAYVPALKAYSDTFARLADRNANLDDRRRAAELILDEKGDAIQFQDLVSKQLAENFQKATENTEKAQRSIETQQGRVTAAQAQFSTSLNQWQEAQKREAALAIVGGIFSFAAGMASIFAGNPAGAANAVQAAENVAKTASKLAELMKKLAKIAKVVAQMVQLCSTIYTAAAKISNARQFAEQMAQVTRESTEGDMKDAPSAGAYWDQLWVEVETALQPALDNKVENAAEYLKELKVLVIYGRALTTAQAAIPPLVQEIARAKLQGEIAQRQRSAVSTEIHALQPKQAASAQAMIMLWAQYRGIQRAMLVALQSYDLAHRYWALEDPRPPRDTNRSIVDLAGDLVAVADVKARQREALESFKPPPQNFVREQYQVPARGVDAFLTHGSLNVYFAPGAGPFQGRGRVGRVRVEEIRAWLVWNDNARPAAGHVELTVRTNGVYDDQRVVARQLKSFHFVGTPVNLTFRYDLASYSEAQREASINTPARVAENFRTAYSEPTLFTEWQISVPQEGGGDTLTLAVLRGKIRGITLEFSGSYIKDPDRVV